MTPVIQVRRAARALVTDPDGRVLLVRVHDDIPMDAADPVRDYWITVGGGLERGESFEDAIVREIREEIGRQVDDPGPCIWQRSKTVTGRDGVVRTVEERYFWCPLPSPELDHAGLSPAERTALVEFRWWELKDPALDAVRVFPETFAAAARDIVRNGRPAAPRPLPGD